jgi:hypothetical protein
MKFTLLAAVQESYAAMVVGLFGGVVSMFNSGKRMTVKQTIGGLLTAMFVGFLLDIGLTEWGFSENTRVMAIAMGGYCARDVMYVFTDKFLKTIKRKVEPDD